MQGIYICILWKTCNVDHIALDKYRYSYLFKYC